VRRRAWILPLVVGLMPLAGLAAEEVPVAVMEFASKGGVSQKQMDALGDLLANEIREMGNFRVIGKADIRAALDLESQKNMLGCNDASCIAEIGGALGVRWVVVGNISLFGDTYLLNLKIMDVEKIRVAKGISRKVTGGESSLIDALATAARELIEGAVEQLQPGGELAKPKEKKPPPEEKPGETKVAEAKPDPETKAVAEIPAATVEHSAPSDPLNTWGHVAFWSGLGVTVLGGGLFMLLGMDEASDYDKDHLTAKERLDAAKKSRTFAGAMYVSAGLGVAMLTTGVVLWLLEGGDAGVDATAGPTPDGQGIGFAVGGRW
jgi:hypothetical protein